MKQTWRLLFHKPLTSSFLSTSSSVLGKQRSYSALTQHCSKYCQIAVSSHRESKTFPDHLQPQASRLRWMPLEQLSLEQLPGPGLLALWSTPALWLTILPSPPSNPSQICMIRCVKILPLPTPPRRPLAAAPHPRPEGEWPDPQEPGSHLLLRPYDDCLILWPGVHQHLQVERVFISNVEKGTIHLQEQQQSRRG